MPSFAARVFAFKFFDALVLIYPLYTVMFVARGLTPVQVSATLMAWSITAFLVQIPSGVLADKYSRRWILAGAQLLRAIGFAAWIIWPSFAGCLIGMMLWGAKSAFSNGTFEALVFDELQAEGRTEDYPRVIGRAQAIGYGSILLASLGAAATVKFGYTALLSASIATALGAAVAAIALPRARQTARTSRNYFALLSSGFQTVAHTPLILGLIAFAALSNAFGGGLEGFWPIFGGLAGLGSAQIAIFVAALSGAQAAGAMFAHRLRNLPTSVFFAIFMLIGILTVTAAGVLKPWSTVLVMALCGLFKMVDVNLDARLHDAMPSQTRATVAAAKSFSGQVVMTGMFMAFGGLAQGASYQAAFLASGGAVMLIGLFCLIRLRVPPQTI